LPTRVVITPIAFPTLNRGREDATGVLSEAGMPLKRSGVRWNSVVGVAVAEGFAGSAGWPPMAASSGDDGARDGGVCADATVTHPMSAQHKIAQRKIMVSTNRRTTSVSALAGRGQAVRRAAARGGPATARASTSAKASLSRTFHIKSLHRRRAWRAADAASRDGFQE
jgi:hypothetical protein